MQTVASALSSLGPLFFCTICWVSSAVTCSAASPNAGIDWLDTEALALDLAISRTESVESLRATVAESNREPNALLLHYVVVCKNPQHIDWLRHRWRHGVPYKELRLLCFEWSIPDAGRDSIVRERSKWSHLLCDILEASLRGNGELVCDRRDALRWLIEVIGSQFDDKRTIHVLENLERSRLRNDELAVLTKCLDWHESPSAFACGRLLASRAANYEPEQILRLASMSRSLALIPLLITKLSPEKEDHRIIKSLQLISGRFDLWTKESWSAWAAKHATEVKYRHDILQEAGKDNQAVAAIASAIRGKMQYELAMDSDLVGVLLGDANIDLCSVRKLLAGYRYVHRTEYAKFARRLLSSCEQAELDKWTEAQLQVLADEKDLSWREYVDFRKFRHEAILKSAR